MGGLYDAATLHALPAYLHPAVPYPTVRSQRARAHQEGVAAMRNDGEGGAVGVTLDSHAQDGCVERCACQASGPGAQMRDICTSHCAAHILLFRPRSGRHSPRAPPRWLGRMHTARRVRPAGTLAHQNCMRLSLRAQAGFHSAQLDVCACRESSPGHKHGRLV